MSIEVSAPTSSESGASHAVVERRSAGFHPSVWGDYFLDHTSRSTATNERGEQNIEKLKMEVKSMLADADDLGKLNLIDRIQRLGIAYKFEKEIDEILEQIHDRCCKCDGADYGHDLHITALLFRLLRQQGYRIPAFDAFNKYKDSEGKFSEALAKDVRGLLSLYEASHLRVHGEDILEEALTFSARHLELVSGNDEPKLSPALLAEVKHALKQAIHKGLTRVEAWHYIRLYEQDASHNEVLLRLAKLDFNWLQKLQQKELSEISRWWKDRVDIGKNFPYARDRIVEGYFWNLGVYFEPEFSLARIILTKIVALTSIMDDTYDVYGTIEELQLLTDAIDRWDMGAIDQLPHYLQIFYRELLDTYKEIEENSAKRGRSYRFIYAKESMQNQARAYFKEAKWFHENYVPTIEEYMAVALETSGYGLLAIASFIGMGDVASKDAFEWVMSDPKIVRGSKLIGRLMNDIASHKSEQKRGHSASAVECLVKHDRITEQEAEKLMWKMVDDAWKDINEELLWPTPVPVALLRRSLNLTRIIELLYKGRDGYTHSGTETKDLVAALLVNPIPV